MWGRHVEHEIREATKKAKTDAQAQSKAMMAMKRLMDPPEEESESEEKVQRPSTPTSGRFRDPASLINKG